MYNRIVVPLDGSPRAERALPAATELAQLQQTPVILLHVIDLNRLDHYGAEAIVGASGLAEQLTNAERLACADLSPLARTLEERGLSATIEVRWGDPAHEIVNEAKPGDLIVMSTHGRGGPARWFLGSVAEAVARRASCPVMLVRTSLAVPASRNEAERLLSQDHYRPEDLAMLLMLEPAVVRQAALSGQLVAKIVDHHVISIAREDAIRWLTDRA